MKKTNNILIDDLKKRMEQFKPINLVFERMHRLMVELSENKEFLEVAKQRLYCGMREDDDVYYLKFAHKKYSEIEEK